MYKEYIKIFVNFLNILDKVGKFLVLVCEIKLFKLWRYMEKRKDIKLFVEYIFIVKNSEIL